MVTTRPSAEQVSLLNLSASSGRNGSAVAVGTVWRAVAAIANLGWREIKLTHPVFAGDTLSAESEVLEKRESKSRPQAGIVSVQTRGFNQDGVLVCVFDRTILVGRRGFDTEAKAKY